MSEINGKFPLPISLATLITEYTAPISIADSIIGYVNLDLTMLSIEWVYQTPGMVLDN